MKNIRLICTPLRFYTSNDENLLFAWLKKVKCIKKIEGVGRELHLFFTSKTLTNEQLLDLMGIFDRYKFLNPEQLMIFMNEKNKILFENHPNE